MRDVPEAVVELFVDRLFDDAALFPPATLPVSAAVPAHRRHRLAWYAPMVGPFVCGAAAVGELDAAARAPMDVLLVVPAGVQAVPDALAAMRAARRLRLVGVELPLAASAAADAARLARDAGVAVYGEVPVAEVDADLLAGFRVHGVRLKLRTGGTVAGAFPSERSLGAALAAAVRAGVPFKCTAGLHSAVRHTDPLTGFEHHGYGNVLLAVAAAQCGADPLPLLAERDGARVATQLCELSPARARAVREAFRSFGTCSVEEAVADMVALGLVDVGVPVSPSSDPVTTA